MNSNHILFILLFILSFISKVFEAEHCLDKKTNGCAKCKEERNSFSYAGVCKCKEGYVREFSTVCSENTIENCALLEDSSKCNYCAKGVLNAEKTSCEGTPTINNCYASYIIGSVQSCEQCNDGYDLNYDKKCYKSLPGCSKYDDDGKCTGCKDGYNLNGGNCEVCTTGCSKCIEGKYLDNNECKDCTAEHCSGCKSLTECTKCVDGYGLDESGSKCVECPVGCKSCASIAEEQVCWECKDGIKGQYERKEGAFTGYSMKCETNGTNPNNLMNSSLILLLLFLI